MNRYIIFLAFIGASFPGMTEWQSLADGNHNEVVFIDLESVKQTGPMAIYRQVNILKQGGAVGKISSKHVVYEYDCMNTKVRILEMSGFSGQWAEGSKVTLPLEAPELKKWHELPSTSLGQKTFDMLCPGGKNS